MKWIFLVSCKIVVANFSSSIWEILTLPKLVVCDLYKEDPIRQLYIDFWKCYTTLLDRSQVGGGLGANNKRMGLHRGDKTILLYRFDKINDMHVHVDSWVHIAFGMSLYDKCNFEKTSIVFWTILVNVRICHIDYESTFKI